jgi:hypothetical protein
VTGVTMEPTLITGLPLWAVNLFLAGLWSPFGPHETRQIRRLRHLY